MDELAKNLAGIDLAIILVYMVGVLALGAFFGKYVHSAGDFFLAGKALPFWAVGMSIVVSDIGATDMMAGAGATYKYGIAQANFDWIGSVPATFIAAFVFIPYYWRAGVYTIPEFLGRRYNGIVQTIMAVIWLCFLTSMLAIMLWMSAKFLHDVTGLNQYLAVWLTVAIVGVYTVSGGLAAVVMTDVMQMIVMFVGAAALLFLCLWETGGWSGMREIIGGLGDETADHFKLLLPHDTTGPYPWTGIVFGLGIVLSTGYFAGNQAVVQRALGARSEWDAKAGMIFAGFLKLFIPILVFVPGLTARALHPDLPEPDSAMPTLVVDLLPPGLTGLMVAAFFAALMSSVDSYLNSCTTMFVSDVYGPLYRQVTRVALPQGQGLILGRVLTVVLIVVAGLTAPVIERFETIYVAIQTMLSLFQGPTLAILLLGILWSRTTGWGAVAGLVLGVSLTGLLSLLGGTLFAPADPAQLVKVFPSDDPFLFISFWSFLFSLAVTVIVSLLTPREPPEKLRGLVFGHVMKDDAAQAVLRERVNGS